MPNDENVARPKGAPGTPTEAIARALVVQVGQRLLLALQEARAAGLTRPDLARLIDGVYEVRRINGFEVVAGWTMPECPPEIVGAVLTIDAHGSDGFTCHWWRKDWDTWPLAKKAMDAAGVNPFAAGDEPRAALVDPDPHDDSCLDAYGQLGFYV